MDSPILLTGSPHSQPRSRSRKWQCSCSAVLAGSVELPFLPEIPEDLSTCGPGADHMSSHLHHLWFPWEVEKATTQARLLPGRYGVEALSEHWVPWNKEGLCSVPLCWGSDDDHKGTVESLLLSCPFLSVTRADMMELC